MKHTTVQSDVAHIVREHKERAVKRRTEEERPQLSKQNEIIMSATTDDATCTRCGRVCKNRRGLSVHQHSCLNKKDSDTHGGVQKTNQHLIPTARHQLPTTRKVKIIELISKNNKNEYTCPNENCGRLLKPQGVTAHVRACTKLWLEKQDFLV